MPGRPSRPSRTTVARSAPATADVMERLLRLRQEAERIVSELFRHTTVQGDAPPGPRIPVDVHEGKDAVHLTLDLPGVKREHLSLSVVGSTLIVEGQKHEVFPSTKAGAPRVEFDCAERVYGAFMRVIELPGAADSSRIEATLDRGVLKVKLPKISERRGRRREVSVG